MPFSPDVKTDLLVKSRRSCCICHRFRGTNIEIHHIKLQAEGGSDDAANGIPLCFDCHAEVEHYNPQHPKGNKYSQNELTKHKENWFEKVNATGVSISIPEHAVIDRRIAGEIHTQITREVASHMPVKSSYAFLRGHSLWNWFDGNLLLPLDLLLYQFSLPDMEFIDADLESLRAKFAADLYKALDAMSRIIFPHDRREGWYTTGGELAIMSSPREDEIREAIKDVDALNSKAAKSYEALYNLVRQKLGLDLRFTNSLTEESDHSLD
jgi:hypothetical protein